MYKVAEVPGVERIRYTTSHPRDMGEDVIQAYRDLPNLTSHLHLPVQSGSDKILKRMKRYYKRDHFLRVVDGLRNARPDILLTDFIVGFPDEDEDDFQMTMDLLNEVVLLVHFPSNTALPGTPALKIKNPVEDHVAGRLITLQDRQREISTAWHRSMEGSVVNVLVEGPSDTTRASSAAEQAPT